MEKKQLQQLIVMLPLILAFGIFGYYKYLLAPMNQRAQDLYKELEGIRKEYRESEARAARLPRLEKEIVILNQEIGEIEKKLPPDQDVPNLIRLLSKKMSAYNISWNRIAPGAQVSKDYYVEHAYSIPFTAEYHRLASFLTEVGQMERIFATRFMRLNYQAADPKSPNKVSGDLLFLIYTSKG
jgi:type IV pilus assembly protein PilO